MSGSNVATSRGVLAAPISLVLGVTLILVGCAAVDPPVPEASPESRSSSLTADGTFVHPGVLVTHEQLEAARARLVADEEPTASAFDRMMASEYASLGHTASPREVVECGPYSNPDVGCSAERRDAMAAYTHALAWYFTKDARHARKSVQIMGAWSARVTDHKGSNAPLQAAWTASLWVKAGEVIRYTYSGWPDEQIDRFDKMLRIAYLPEVDRRSQANGNWELAMSEATLAIAVFVEDEDSFNRGLDVLRDRVPAYIYLDEDGQVPRVASGSSLATSGEILDYWHNPHTLRDGMSQETCRDLGHTGYGLASIAHATETAGIQGVDLYPEFGPRLASALELHSRLSISSVVPVQPCAGDLEGHLGPLPESALATLGERFGCAMPATRDLGEQQSRIGTDEHIVAWEDLTHGTLQPDSPSGAPQDGSPVCPDS